MEPKNIIFIDHDYQQNDDFKRWMNLSQEKYNFEIKLFKCIFELCYLIDKKKIWKKYRLIAIIDKQGIAPFLYLSKLGCVVASVYDEYSAYMTPFHNNTNILTTGYEICGTGLIISILSNFFKTKFEGGRHYARIDMLNLEITKGLKQ